jgi:superoxide dismutase, Fe-Mn family
VWLISSEWGCPELHTNVDSLNEAIAHYPRLDNTAIEDLLEHLNDVPEEIRDAVRNSGGGHANHELLWKVIGPPERLKTQRSA